MAITAMEILERCRQAPGDLDELERQKARLWECAQGIWGQDLNRVGSPGTAEPDRMSAFSAEIDEVERKIVKRLQEKAAEEKAACKLISYIPAIMGEVLYRYYVGGMPLAAIATHCNYHPSYVRKQKARGDSLVRQTLDKAVIGLMPEWYLKEAA